MQTDPRPRRGSHRYPAIDLLRIFAAGAVVAFHYAYLFPSEASAFPNGVRIVSSYGYLGVELFFMISGYVIALSAAGRTRRQFAHGRFVRLWPTFVVAVALTLCVVGWPGTLTLLANLTMLPHLLGAPYIDGVYWSLMFEIVFYFWIAVLVISRGNFEARLRIFAVCWLVLAIIGQFVSAPKIGVLLALAYAPYFAVGMSIYLVRNGARAALDWGLLGVSSLIAFWFAIVQARLVGGAAEIFHPLPWLCGVIVLLSAISLYASTFVELGPRLSRIALALGGISYPLYLLHDEFGLRLVHWLGPLGMVVVVAVCYGIWRLERPMKAQLARAYAHCKSGVGRLFASIMRV